ncbi:hypothetical protein D6D54_01490 [Spiroplasma poulsonii]|uniref:Uncharacterized protein n=1 Tax=Spiroplasma poulsonii TaxID=2138 RepID=A0A3S0SKI1_9MOLU|nr:hypothetical protein [Spiroplasma poulsonii]MBW3057636.1 hypothetical protein [Spiroplasma poulsonii]MBW3057870.1 hypothetical protein [Spiroplasma poulsonii]MBW3058050.1 hypothetical protein [Spiroplasma poulsonii]MBW3059223.1 hypothetical protein [Spiroplasma poulsonii]RUP75888.1 hypothetical protein D6D54_07565 [Spiroplasma poulsonii]
MNNNKFNTLNDREWLRLTGIKKSTFNKMLDILKVAEIEKFKKGGKTNRLLALLVKKLQIFVKKILIEKYNFN